MALLVEHVDEGDEQLFLLGRATYRVECAVHGVGVVMRECKTYDCLAFGPVPFHKFLRYHQCAALYKACHRLCGSRDACAVFEVGHGYTPVVVDSLEQHSLGLGKPRRGVLLVVGIDFYKGLALNFQSRREGRFHYIAYAAQIVFANPFPQTQLRMPHYRPGVEYSHYVLYLHIFRRDGRKTAYDGCIQLFASERHDNPAADAYLSVKLLRYAVGKRGPKRQRQYHFRIH